MTTTVPRRSRVSNGECLSANNDKVTKRHDSRLPAVSLILGTLSIGSFWVVGLGFVLGVTAVFCGAIATLRSSVSDDEAASLRALLGVVAGTAGITVSAIALFPTLAFR